MSADDLIAASTRIRHDVDFQQAYGDDTFLLAVADWLDNCASTYYCSGPAELRSAVTVARTYLEATA